MKTVASTQSLFQILFLWYAWNGSQVSIVVDGFSSYSTFLGQGRRPMMRQMNTDHGSVRSSLVMYEEPAPSKPDAWSVLATTEKWITETLEASAGPTGVNAYARKQGVSYVCETSSESPLIVAGIFRRIRQLREAGEKHGQEQEALEVKQGPPRTLRQTQVVVVPANKALTDSFHVFEDLMEQIKQARRNARDLVTDLSLQELDDEEDDEDDERQWSVSVNCAHMHPHYGQLTAEQQLQEMKQEDEDGEVDVNYQEYVQRRNKARRSPFPTIVMEVRSVPPPDFSRSPPPPADLMAGKPLSEEPKVSLQDIQKLEALFGKSAHVDDTLENKKKDSFYDSIGNSIQEVSAITPLQLAQQWIAKNDAALQQGSSVVASFTETHTQQVDEAYEFTFTNLAMMKEMIQNEPDSTVFRQYLVMPFFLSYAATSFEKFCLQVEKIIQVLPDCKQHVHVEVFHPEHVDQAKRSPTATMVLEWNNEKK